MLSKKINTKIHSIRFNILTEAERNKVFGGCCSCSEGNTYVPVYPSRAECFDGCSRVGGEASSNTCPVLNERGKWIMATVFGGVILLLLPAITGICVSKRIEKK